MNGIKIICHTWLEPNTIIVSKDIYDMMKKTLSIEGQDKAFLRALGVKTEEEKTQS